MATINGMVIDNNEIEFLNTETSEINGNVTINGNLIVNGKAPINENLICDFCTGTEEQIEAMLEAHYRGDIDVEDY